MESFKLTDALVRARKDRYKFQYELGVKLSWPPWKIGRFENSSDGDKRLRDLVPYANAVGYSLRIIPNDTAVEE